MHSYHNIAQDLLARLKKVEGQTRGVQKMIEEERYCVDILAQLSAIKAAVSKVELALLESHTRGCVADAIREDNGEEKIRELMEVIRACTR